MLGEQPDLTGFADIIIGHCPRYERSSLYRPRTHTVILSPEDSWINAIEKASVDTEILLLDGDYELDKYAVLLRSSVTIRSFNADPERVRIWGQGYDVDSEGFMVLANDVTIADISIGNIRDHAVVVNPVAGAQRGLQLYNLSITNVGTQHIKVNPGGAIDGLIACSSIGYSLGGAQGDYNGAINLHGSINWIVRDNTIFNIRGDGSGCIVDRECGRYISAPAILAWNGAQGTRIVGNAITDSFRNIALGIGTPHYGGSIQHNVIVQARPGDAGIELFGASDVVVEYNTVQLSGGYPGAVEFRQSNHVKISNNWLSRPPWNRGGNRNITLSKNTLRVSDSPHLR